MTGEDLSSSLQAPEPVFTDISQLLGNLSLIEELAFAELDAERDKEKVFEHCMKVIDMMDQELNGHVKKAKTLMNRPADTYFSLLPPELKEVFPILYYEIFKCDIRKTMSFIKTYSLFRGSGIRYDVSITFDGFKEGIVYGPDAIAALKLYQYHDWFMKLSPEEKKRRILQKGIMKETILDVMEPMLAELEKYGREPKIVIYGPREFENYKGRDLFRAMVEKKIFDRLAKKYGKHEQVDLRTDRNIENLVEAVRRNCYLS